MKDYSKIAAFTADRVVQSFAPFVSANYPHLHDAWTAFAVSARDSLLRYAGKQHWGKAIVDAESVAKLNHSLGLEDVLELMRINTSLITVVSNRLDRLDVAMIDGYVSAVHVAGDVTLYNVDWDSDVLEVSQYDDEEDYTDEYELDAEWVVCFLGDSFAGYELGTQEALEDLNSGSVVVRMGTSEIFLKDGDTFYYSDVHAGVPASFFDDKLVAVVAYG